MSLNNLAALYEATGEYARALALYERSLAIREKALGPEHNDVARSLNDLAGIYQEMGEYEKALLLFQRGVAIREKALGPEHPDLGRILNHLAEVYRKLRQYAKAQPVYARALAIFEKTLGPEHPHVAAALHNYASLYHDMGEYASALPLYERSHAILEKALGPEHPDVATSLNNIAGVYLVTGQYEKALQLAQRSLLIGSGRAVPEVVWRAQERLSAVYGAQKRRSAAIFWGKQAVNTLQGLRARLTALERELQRSYLTDKRGAYARLADHLIEEGRLPEAQQVMAMLKEEEFFDFIRRDARGDPRTTQAAYTAQEESWARRYREIGNRLAAIGTELETLRRKARQGLTGAEQERRTALEGDLRVARQAFDRFLGELMKEIAQADARRALEIGERNLTNLRALQGTLASLGHGAVAVHYLMGEEKLRILLTTPAVQLAREAPVTARELNRGIEQFRRVLQDPRRDPLPLAREMYQVLIAPIAEDLVQAGAQTLMVSLDGTLRYIPLAALHDGKRYLVEAYRLAIFTEAAKDKLKDAPQRQWRFAGLGLTRGIEGFSPLSGVKEELEGIVKHGERGVLPGEVHFDQAFTAGRVRDSLDRAFPVLHIASHFVFRPGTEADSFLLLGDGSRLTLREIKESDFDFRNVDLITLSACETAVGGGRDATGQEIEGLGALAQRQGAKGVIATLWPVADVSTGVMMQSFYAIRETQRGVTKAEALRQAQLQLIRGSHAKAALPQGERGAKRAENARSAAGWMPDPARPYAHPYFWAPFILMGNWL
ncbi:MAG: CHAT domain-containing protein [Betaproteobacteria bacterium]|nr:CHAT domain-containing protein [Betaproteobacteria bacterium]